MDLPEVILGFFRIGVLLGLGCIFRTSCEAFGAELSSSPDFDGCNGCMIEVLHPKPLGAAILGKRMLDAETSGS